MAEEYLFGVVEFRRIVQINDVMKTPEDIYLKALNDIQDICYPILDSGKYETSHSKIAEIASDAIRTVNLKV